MSVFVVRLLLYFLCCCGPTACMKLWYWLVVSLNLVSVPYFVILCSPRIFFQIRLYSLMRILCVSVCSVLFSAFFCERKNYTNDWNEVTVWITEYLQRPLQDILSVAGKIFWNLKLVALHFVFTVYATKGARTNWGIGNTKGGKGITKGKGITNSPPRKFGQC